jgi:hypothetical protein
MKCRFVRATAGFMGGLGPTFNSWRAQRASIHFRQKFLKPHAVQTSSLPNIALWPFRLMPIHHWREALNHFTILWPERMPALERVS